MGIQKSPVLKKPGGVKSALYKEIASRGTYRKENSNSNMSPKKRMNGSAGPKKAFPVVCDREPSGWINMSFRS